jgi:hypothetical protein
VKQNAIHPVDALAGYIVTFGSTSEVNYEDGVFFAFMSNSSTMYAHKASGEMEEEE